MNLAAWVLTMLLVTHNAFAQPGKKEANGNEKEMEKAMAQLEQYARFMDSVNKALQYTTRKVSLPEANAVLNIPAGFKFLNARQSQYIVHDVWNNPGGQDVLGMIFPDNGGPFADSSYAFVITYEALGYVKDNDAKDIDYTEMLKSGQEEEKQENEERTKAGYQPIHWVGWAQSPYYDANRKVLHWAKELKFGNDEEQNTLNYDVRVLGREGVLSMNAVASMSELPMVKEHINEVLQMASFVDGYAYGDFNSSTDKVAAYTVGGLVAGKVLAKAGFFALLAKGWKFIIIGLVALGAALKRFFFGKKQEEEQDGYENTAEESLATTDAALPTTQQEGEKVAISAQQNETETFNKPLQDEIPPIEDTEQNRSQP